MNNFTKCPPTMPSYVRPRWTRLLEYEVLGENHGFHLFGQVLVFVFLVHSHCHLRWLTSPFHLKTTIDYPVEPSPSRQEQVNLWFHLTGALYVNIRGWDTYVLTNIRDELKKIQYKEGFQCTVYPYRSVVFIWFCWISYKILVIVSPLILIR